MRAQAEFGLNTILCRPQDEEGLLLRLMRDRLCQLPVGLGAASIIGGQALIVLRQLLIVPPDLELASPCHRQITIDLRQPAGLRRLGARWRLPGHSRTPSSHAGPGSGLPSWPSQD